ELFRGPLGRDHGHAGGTHPRMDADRLDVELAPRRSAMKIANLTRMKKQQGMSLIELMFAGFVLTVGMMGSLIMITVAIASNSRNKFDSTGTMVAQMIMEHINTMPTNQLDSAGVLVDHINVADCDRPGNSPAT